MTVVLEAVEESSSAPRRAPGASAGREKSPQLLRFVTLDADDHHHREPTAAGPRSRRNSRDPAASIEPTREAPLATAAAAAVGAAEYARCRTRLAGWLFRPLLSDAFALASLTQALSLLGLGGGDGQAAVLVRDMAAWFLALPVGRAADTTVGREAQNCPVLRWLKGVILAWASPPPPSKRSAWDRGGGEAGQGEGLEKSFLDQKVAPSSAAVAGRMGRRMADLFDDPVEGGDSGAAGAAAVKGGGMFGDESPTGTEGSDAGRQEKDREEEEEEEEVEEEEEEEEADDNELDVGSYDGDHPGSENLEARVEEILRPMFEACAASRRLENASMLSVVTAEALAACHEKLEESSLGQVAIGGGEAWVTLARRLRLCLFVDHRLHWGVRTEKRWDGLMAGVEGLRGAGGRRGGGKTLKRRVDTFFLLGFGMRLAWVGIRPRRSGPAQRPCPCCVVTCDFFFVSNGSSTASKPYAKIWLWRRGAVILAAFPVPSACSSLRILRPYTPSLQGPCLRAPISRGPSLRLRPHRQGPAHVLSGLELFCVLGAGEGRGGSVCAQSA